MSPSRSRFESVRAKSFRTLLQAGWNRVNALLTSPIDGASLAAFRIVYGVIMAYYAVNYLWPKMGTTALAHHFTDVGYHFKYPGFAWVTAWPEPFLTIHFLVLAAAGIALALGFFYRVAAVTMFLAFTYIFLLDEARYNNHYYLMSLLSFLLIWMPANARFSFDAWWRHRVRGKGDPNCGLIPFWPVALLRVQLFVMYFYGGIAKLDSDWLSGVPMLSVGFKWHEMLEKYVLLPDFLSVEFLCQFMVWFGLIFDLSIGFLLLYRRTRFLALGATLIFHGTNHLLFPIGVFPFLAFFGTLIFLEADWPLRVWHWVRHPRLARPDWKWLIGGPLLCFKQRAAESPTWIVPPKPGSLTTSLFVLWVGIQILLPFRHYVIAGDASWTEEGHKFSWRMMLRAKKPAHLVFRIKDPGVKVRVEKGTPHVDWNDWPEDSPRITYVAIDSHKLNWPGLPELVTIYENGIGERLIYNPYTSSRPAKSWDECRQRINKVWLSKFGRQPAVYETIDVGEAFVLAKQRLSRAETPRQAGESSRRDVAELLERGASLNDKLQLNRGDQLIVSELADVIHRILKSDFSKSLRPAFSRMHPLAMNGANYQGAKFLVVGDSSFDGVDRTGELKELTKSDAYPVWVDLARLRSHGWAGLPQTMFCYLDGRPRILWNYFTELNVKQVEELATHPWMLHRYAKRIASEWKGRTGRQPEVRAMSLVVINYRPTQLQVDPKVDLATVHYHNFNHNPWIKQIQGDLPPLAELVARAEPVEPVPGNAPKARVAAQSRTTKRH